MMEIVMESVYTSVWKKKPPQSSISSPGTENLAIAVSWLVGGRLSLTFSTIEVQGSDLLYIYIYIYIFLSACSVFVCFLVTKNLLYFSKNIKAEHVGTDVSWPLLLFLWY